MMPGTPLNVRRLMASKRCNSGGCGMVSGESWMPERENAASCSYVAISVCPGSYAR